MASAVVVPKEPGLPEELETLVGEQARTALSIEVKDQETYDRAAEFLRGLKDLKGEVLATFEPLKKKTHAAWKAVVAAEKEKLEPIDHASGIVRQKIADFTREQRRIQEAREAEVRKAAVAAEKKRIAAEARLAKREGSGAAEIAEIKHQPTRVGDIAIAPTFTKAPGISTRKIWDFRVVDKNKLIKAIADGFKERTPSVHSPEFLKIDAVALRAYATQSRGTVTIQGVEFFDKDSVTVGSK